MAAMVPDIRADDDVLSLREAALILGVSRHSAYIWALSGRLAARQLAGRYVTRRVDVERCKREREAVTAGAAAVAP